MGATVLVVGEQLDGVLSDTTYELAALARRLADGGSVIVAGGGPGFESSAGSIAADTVCVLDGAQMADYLPEAYAAAISALAAERGAELVLAATSAVGLDTAAAVSASLGAPLVSYVVAAVREGGALVTTSQFYGGKLLAESEVDGGRAVLTVVPGSASGEAGRGSAGTVENVAAAAAPGRMSFRRMIRPEAGGVDITKEEILVSVGRGNPVPRRTSSWSRSSPPRSAARSRRRGRSSTAAGCPRSARSASPGSSVKPSSTSRWASAARPSTSRG